MEDLGELLARGEKLRPIVCARDGIVVVERPGASTEVLTVSVAVAIAESLLDAAAAAAGQSMLKEEYVRRRDRTTH